MVPASSETFRSLTLCHTAGGCVRCSSLVCNCCPQHAALTTKPASPTYNTDRSFISATLRFLRLSVRLSVIADIHFPRSSPAQKPLDPYCHGLHARHRSCEHQVPQACMSYDAADDPGD